MGLFQLPHLWKFPYLEAWKSASSSHIFMVDRNETALHDEPLPEPLSQLHMPEFKVSEADEFLACLKNRVSHQVVIKFKVAHEVKKFFVGTETR